MRPRLVHPVQVVFRRLDKTSTTYDPDFREPVEDAGATYNPAEVFGAQVRFNTFEKREMTPGGETPATSGSLLYRRGEVPSLKKGDRVDAVDGMPLTNVFIVSVEPAAASGSTYHLERAFFQERRTG